MVIIQGKIYWAKVLAGQEEVNPFNNAPQWSFDLTLTEDTKKELLSKGMLVNKIRNKNDDRGDFITFSRRVTKKDGSPGKPFDIIDHEKKPWTTTLIGNGSTVNVKLTFNKREFKGKEWNEPGVIGIQVWTLVPFTMSKNDFPVDEGRPEAVPSENW